jgi:truncated hemoglobin YjbI
VLISAGSYGPTRHSGGRGAPRHRDARGHRAPRPPLLRPGDAGPDHRVHLHGRREARSRAHVPRITSFWETILLGGQFLPRRRLPPHAELHLRVGLREGHFDRWLQLWFGTSTELFEGDRANVAKIHALRVARAFLSRLENFPDPDDAAQAPPPARSP